MLFTNRDHSAVASPKVRSLALAASGVVLAVVLSACSAGSPAAAPATSAKAASGNSSPADPAKAGKAAKLVPKEFKDKGTLVVGLDASTPPGEYIDKDGTTVVGYQADLIKAVGQKLGIDMELENAGFDTIIPGLASGRIDIGQAGMYAKPARMEKADFISYALIGSTLFTSSSSKKSYNGLDSLCGAGVAVQLGTSLQTMLEDQSKKCTAAGKAAVNVLTFNNGNEEVLAVGSGRADAGFDSQETINYLIKQSNGQYKVTGSPIAANVPSSIAVKKGTGLDKAIQAALEEMIADGSYAKIFEKWGVAPIMIKKPALNDVGNPAS
ncbi:ABC transporter substrate-binding protein [Microbacterium capsulatum]|uniref:ABC transporter substrate-binding protein n=1 Tax=Microbacterium capsulatum TaxID=3041921 RepID=A0ABU0XIN6_9MICO|nr:ABC transporter substrate-binding protein [Microbacterium sp. ASV81]MDQ4214971.1 ABC transporter substrate-binding protein [Microbacterium sp. ASV81]